MRITAPRRFAVQGVLPPGTRLGTDLVLGERLGEGGTGSVYAGYHEVLKREVAVKICDRSGPDGQALAERLMQEARMCASVRDARVPRIYALDKLDSGAPYLVMEKIHGEPLSALLERGQLRARVACELACELLKALEAVHRAHIIHRDVKPSNIMVELRDRSAGGHGIATRLRLLDFGIGKAMSDLDVCEADPALTRPGEIIGTPMYMAPEQMTEGKVDQRADIYSAGVVLFEMLAGRPPFSAPSVAAMFVAVLHDDMPQLGDLRPSLPDDLVSVVHKAAARRFDERYASAREMRLELERALAQLAPESEPPTDVFVASDQCPTLQWRGEPPSQSSSGRRLRARPLPLSLARTLKMKQSGDARARPSWAAQAGFLARRQPFAASGPGAWQVQSVNFF